MKHTERVGRALRLMEQLHFPTDSIGYLSLLERSYFLTGDYAEELDRLETSFMTRQLTGDQAILRLKEIAAAIGVPDRSLSELFYLNCAYDLEEVYHERNIDPDIFLRSMDDLRCKMLECREMHGVWGNDTGSWPDGFFRLERFGLGRLQFEIIPFEEPDYHWNGLTIRTRDPVLNVHIPSGGSFPRASRYDAYRRAYQFYSDFHWVGGRYLPINCISWLLYKKHEEFLPPTSNILDFIHDFDIFASYDERPVPPWRIFGKHCTNPPEHLPRDTSLRRAYADWLLTGHTCGYGRGMILFDGEKIVNNAREK